MQEALGPNQSPVKISQSLSPRKLSMMVKTAKDGLLVLPNNYSNANAN